MRVRRASVWRDLRDAVRRSRLASRSRAAGGGAALAIVVLALLLAGCGGSGGHKTRRRAPNYGAGIAGQLPPVGRPARGGAITVGQLAGQTPSDIFPLIDDSACSTPTIDFIQNQYIPLYAGPVGAQPRINRSLSAAELPRYSDGDRTVTITLKPGLRWSDGKPVDAQDVVFYLDLLKAALSASAANWCQYAAGGIPSNIASWTTSGANTVILHLTHAVNPSWFTADQLQDVGAGIYPLPSRDWDISAPGGTPLSDWQTNPADALKIYDYLAAQGRDASSFAANPLWKIVDGPFRLAGFSATDGSYQLVPNPAYSLAPRARVSEISVRTYQGSAAILQALKRRTLDIGPLDATTQLGAIPRLRRAGYSVFGGPGWGWFGGVINFRDTTDHFDRIIAQPYVRGVLAELLDQRTIIHRVYHGWAVPAYGPVPTAPRSPYRSAALSAAWHFNPTRASSTLKAHGWRVRPGGQTTCARPGNARDECGAGIPKGTPLSLVWANVSRAVSPVGALESQIYATEARRAAGIGVRFVSGRFSYLTSNYNDQNPAAAARVNDWAVNNYGGVYIDYYPTQQGLLGSGGSLNLGGFDDPVAERLMAASVASASATAIDREVSYLTHQYAVLYMPDQDWVTAVGPGIGGPWDAFRAMTQQQYPLQFLYRTRRRRR